MIGWCDENVLVEVKNAEGLNQFIPEKEFFLENWRGRVIVLRHGDEAVELLNGINNQTSELVIGGEG